MEGDGWEMEHDMGGGEWWLCPLCSLHDVFSLLTVQPLRSNNVADEGHVA